MSALKSFQQRMAAAVMAPLTARQTMARRRPDGMSMELEAAAFVKPNDRLSSFERLEIYNRQYWFRLLDSIGEDFPGLQAVLGRDRFHGLVRAYLAECPSRSFTLRNLGSRLEPWLADHPRWSAPRGPLALDMVRLEWAHIEAFDETAGPVLTAGDLAAVNESTRLFLQPHVRLLHLAHPVDDLLVKVRADLAACAPSGNHAVTGRRVPPVRRTPAPPPAERFLAVHRHDDSVYYKQLEPEAFRILAAIRSGAPLGAALEAGFEGSALAEAGRPAFLGETFHDWAAFGWFSQPPRSN